MLRRGRLDSVSRPQRRRRRRTTRAARRLERHLECSLEDGPARFGSSSPITLGDKIFVTAYSGYGLGEDDPGKPEEPGTPLALPRSGHRQIFWEKSVKAALPEQDTLRSQINMHGYASSTPVTDGKAVYVFYGRSGVYAYSLTR